MHSAETGAPAVAITLTDIHKAFGETQALAGASLHCRPGDVHAIVGENGSGKSTLAKVMSGVILADSGTVDILGHAPRSPAEARAAGIATIFQEILVAEDLTVWENVFAGADGFWRRRISTAEKRRRCREALSRLAMTDIDPDATVAQLPLNVRQWIVIVRAILQKPRVLIFDESSAALDLEASNRLYREIETLKQAGTCVMLVTHRIAELVRIADSATVLRDGRTVGHLERSEISEQNLLRLLSADGHHAVPARRKKGVMPTAQRPALEAHGLQLAPGAAPFDFGVRPGEIVGLAGLDGAGQADFAAVLAGIRMPTLGSVRARSGATGSTPITSLAEADAAGVAYVSGDRRKEGIFPNLSILENFGLAIYHRLSGRGGLIDRQALDTAFATEVERLGIRFGRVTDAITTLSGGNQQKVLIARAFALSPRVIILNDPARGVDVGTKQDLYRHLRRFASNGGAVVYLSTEIEEFFNFADRADVFVDGTLFASFGAQAINEANLLAAMFGQATRTPESGPMEREVVA